MPKSSGPHTHAYAALRDRFASHEEFDDFYASIEDGTKRNSFLRVSSFYRFLVKDGDWHVKIKGSVPVVNYITDTLKLVSIFSLVESLSEIDHLDLFQWISAQDPATIFPILTKKDLSVINDRYKEEHGSIRKCVAFFQNLPPERQKALCATIRIKNLPFDSIEKFAKHLYDLRSGFVHRGRFALELMPGMVWSKKSTKFIEAEIDIRDVAQLFEEGLLLWFRHAV